MTLTKIALALFLVLTLLSTACQRDGNDPTMAEHQRLQDVLDSSLLKGLIFSPGECSWS